MASLLLTPGLDTWLARLLQRRGRLELSVLQDALAEVRSARARTGETLALHLAQQGLLGQEELEDCVRSLLTRVNVETTPGDEPPGQEAAHLRIEGFRIARQLGAGGMGAVFEAIREADGARVAIKVLPLGSEPELLLRFQREAEAQARVDSHPNVVRIHQTGNADGHAYLVMDLASGGDLQAKVERGPLDPREAARVVRDLAHGLHHVHLQGVLHRDLKPANVLFEGEVPKLVDFGLARLVEAEGLTQSGTILGTPAYMAPEQVRGEAVDPRTDVYALGGVLYACLTGRAPFQGGSAVAVMYKVTSEPPPAPRERAPRVPPELEAVCLCALAKAPNERPRTAAELADQLDRFLKGTPSAGPGGLLTGLLVAACALPLGVLLGQALPASGDVRQPSPETAPHTPADPEPPLVPSNREGRVRALLDRATRHLAAGRERAASDALERAFLTSPLLAAENGRALVPLLARHARQTLSRPELGPDLAAEVARARRFLVWARLTDPQADLPVEALEQVTRESPHAAVRAAARPASVWLGSTRMNMDESLANVRLQGLARPQTDDVRTWPAGLTTFYSRIQESGLPSLQGIPVYQDWMLQRPDLSVGWGKLGWCYRNVGRDEEAYLCARVAAEIEGSPITGYLHAATLHEVGRSGEAERVYAGLDPRRIRSNNARGWFHYHRARAQIALGRHREAIATLAPLEHRFGGHGGYWLLLERCHLHRGDMERARECAAKVRTARRP